MKLFFLTKELLYMNYMWHNRLPTTRRCWSHIPCRVDILHQCPKNQEHLSCLFLCLLLLLLLLLSFHHIYLYSSLLLHIIIIWSVNISLNKFSLCQPGKLSFVNLILLTFRFSLYYIIGLDDYSRTYFGNPMRHRKNFSAFPNFSLSPSKPFRRSIWNTQSTPLLSCTWFSWQVFDE